MWSDSLNCRVVFCLALLMAIVSPSHAQTRRNTTVPGSRRANTAPVVKHPDAAVRRDDVKLPRLLQENVVDTPAQSMRQLRIPVAWEYRPPELLRPAKSAAPSRPDVINLGSETQGLETMLSTPLPKYFMVYYRVSGGTVYDSTLFPPMEIRVFDSASGRQIAAGSLPPGYTPRALSDDGKRVLAEWTWRRHRVDVFELRPARHVVGWRPHPDPRKPSVGDEQLKGTLSLAVFTDPDHVITATPEDGIARWHLPDCTAVYKYVPGPRLSLYERLTADGRCYIMENGSLFDLVEGKFLGQLPGMPKNSKLFLSPDGRRLVATSSYAQESDLKIYDLASGAMVRAIVRQTLRSSSGTQSVWCSEDYLIFHSMLLDLNTGYFVWRVNSYIPEQRYAADNRTWFFTGDSTMRRLVCTEFPGEELIDAIKVGGEGMSGAIVHPDMEVCLTIDHQTAPPDPEDFRQKQTQGFKDQLAKTRIRVVDDAPVKLRVTVLDGDEVTYVSSIHANKPVSAKAVVCRCEWIGPDNAVIWKGEASVAMSTLTFSGEISDATLRAKFWERQTEDAGRQWIPHIVYPADQKGVAAGHAEVDIDGRVKFAAD